MGRRACALLLAVSASRPAAASTAVTSRSLWSQGGDGYVLSAHFRAGGRPPCAREHEVLARRRGDEPSAAGIALTRARRARRGLPPPQDARCPHWNAAPWEQRCPRQSTSELGAAEMQDTFAARAGRWSTRHRGMAIGLWLAFVMLAVAAGQAAGLVKSDENSGNGETARAERAIDASFPKAADESVLIQAPHGATVSDARVRAAVADVIATVARQAARRRRRLAVLRPRRARHLARPAFGARDLRAARRRRPDAGRGRRRRRRRRTPPQSATPACSSASSATPARTRPRSRPRSTRTSSAPRRCRCR